MLTVTHMNNGNVLVDKEINLCEFCSQLVRKVVCLNADNKIHFICVLQNFPIYPFFNFSFKIFHLQLVGKLV